MNELPSFTCNDDALWRRIIILPFRTKFCSSPKHKYEKHKNNEIEKKFKGKSEFYNKFINLLLKYYSHTTNLFEEMPDSCKIVLDSVNAFENDFNIFLETHLKYELNSVTSYQQIIGAYKSVDPQFIMTKVKAEKEYIKCINTWVENFNSPLRLDTPNRIPMKYGTHRVGAKVVRGIKNLTIKF